MLNIIAIIAIVIVVLIAAVLVFAATKSNTCRFTRAASIKAPPERIFAFINDFDHWAAWSPYEKKDPLMKRTRSGAPKGKGAIYAWDGDKNIGKGRMEIADTSPPSKITINLDFEKPFKAHNVVEFTMEPKGDATNVTWAMHGRANFMAKVVSVFINMDRMVGKDFEAGLASLKDLAERKTADAPMAVAPG